MEKKIETAQNAEITFEQALKELEAIVRKLENGAGDLDASINDYVRGTELKEYCQKKLVNARLKVESIIKIQDKGASAALSLQAFDAN